MEHLSGLQGIPLPRAVLHLTNTLTVVALLAALRMRCATPFGHGWGLGLASCWDRRASPGKEKATPASQVICSTRLQSDYAPSPCPPSTPRPHPLQRFLRVSECRRAILRCKKISSRLDSGIDFLTTHQTEVQGQGSQNIHAALVCAVPAKQTLCRAHGALDCTGLRSR